MIIMWVIWALLDIWYFFRYFARWMIVRVYYIIMLKLVTIIARIFAGH